MAQHTDYWPSDAVLTHLRQAQLVGVIGPTGAGKTTIITQALKRNADLYLVVTDTTRTPRPDERDGLDYFFQDAASMQARTAAREYVNVAPRLNGGDCYASHMNSYRQQGIGLMALFAEVIPYFRQLPFQSFTTVYIVPSSFEVWLGRVRERGFTSEQLTARLAEARRSLVASLALPDMRFVINDDLGTAVANFIAVVQAGSDELALAGQQAGRARAEQFLERLIKEIEL